MLHSYLATIAHVVPQIIMGLVMLGTVAAAIATHGIAKRQVVNAYVVGLTVAAEALLLWWGGFWG